MNKIIKRIASELCSWGKQALNHLLMKMIDELFVQFFRRFLKKRKSLRQNKSSKRRIIKFLALIIGVVIVFGLCVVAPIIDINCANDETTTVISAEQICSADKEEVQFGLPIQRYMENNSVNSAKICNLHRALFFRVRCFSAL